MTYVDLLTFLHTAVSLVAIALGVPAVRSLFRPGLSGWRRPFFATAALTTGSGFLFPFVGPTPAFLVGIVAALVLAAAALAVRRGWPRIYAGAMTTSLYFLIFVLIAQAFLKVPPLHRLAPTGSEPPFAVAQLAALAVFVWIGIASLRAANASAGATSG